MARDTARDEIWKLALIHTLTNGDSIRPADFSRKVQASERTVRDTLNSMASTPFLRRDVDTSTGEVRFLPPENRDFSE